MYQLDDCSATGPPANIRILFPRLYQSPVNIRQHAVIRNLRYSIRRAVNWKRFAAEFVWEGVKASNWMPSSDSLPVSFFLFMFFKLCNSIQDRQPPKTSESRLATETKAEFTLKVNEHFVEGA